MPRKPFVPATLADDHARPQLPRDAKPQTGFDPGRVKGGKGGPPKKGASSLKRMPIPGKGWGR